jgi:ABC-2 type transport system ATP-binding protein
VPQAGLEIEGVSKRYGEVVALRDLTMRVRPGELFGFVGGNGAGKTTTMRIVLGVLAADAGVVRLGGVPVDFASRRGIGYMPEERGLYPKMRVLDQLVYLAGLHGLDRHTAHREAETWIDRLGLRAHRTDEVQKLSLGNQQRVQLAAALSHRPGVLVLDEPFSGLDPLAVDVMSEVLREQADAGVPVVFSSHQLDLVERICDRVGIIQQGQLVACDDVKSLRDKGSRRYVIDGPAGWADSVPGVTVVSAADGRTLVELADGTDDQTVLHAALAAGPVREFSRVRRTLAELFRDVVTENGDPR